MRFVPYRDWSVFSSRLTLLRRAGSSVRLEQENSSDNGRFFPAEGAGSGVSLVRWYLWDTESLEEAFAEAPLVSLGARPLLEP